MSSLPIDDVLPEIISGLEKSCSLVLHAPPGAGKTTCVPLHIFKQSKWLNNQRIVMLEPRRLAARAAATRMAQLLGEAVGKTVGYRTRLDTCVTESTKIEVVTEGVLTRMIQTDPELDGIGCIIFDEYHERSLNTDLGLAFTLDVQASLREDLRLVIMSATLDVDQLLILLGDVPVVSSAGRSFPVDVNYLGSVERDMVDGCVKAINKALTDEHGSVLVFLPGEREIKQVAAALSHQAVEKNVIVAPLYGSLSREEQDQAILPCVQGRRKIVLATAIAETSLTIEGVRVVIDAGLMRVSRFDNSVGMSRLETLRVSKAAAEQRCGRAGRTEPGVCYRLWSREQHKGLVAFHSAEIMSADLVPLVLELAQWGVADTDALHWVDRPPQISCDRARQLLVQLGALNSKLRITEHGQAMLRLGLHPRLAHMLLHAKKIGLGSLACDVAALLSERDIFRRRDIGADLSYRLNAMRGDQDYKKDCDKAVLHRVKQTANQLRSKLRVDEKKGGSSIGLLLSMAYPDRVAQLRSGSDGRFLLSNGKGVYVDPIDVLSQEQYIVVAHQGGRGKEPRAFLAATIDKSEILKTCVDSVIQQEVYSWADNLGAVVARSETKLGALVLSEQRITDLDREKTKQVLLDEIKQSKFELLGFGEKQQQWFARVKFITSLIDGGDLTNRLSIPWPVLNDESLINSIDDWLGPFLDGVTNLEQLGALDKDMVLANLLSWEQQQWLEELLPTHFIAPTGTRVRIDYCQEDGPVIGVRLQELFGLSQTPAVANGLIKLKLQLLSPARRPIQITRDLPGFWSGSYTDVRKEMKGRYPKHYWPEDPLTAEPTKWVKPKA